METIYKNAVEKCISNLSDKCVDLSDDNLNLALFAAELEDMGPEETRQQQHLQLGTSGYQPTEMPEDKAK